MSSLKYYIYCLEFYDTYNEKTGKHDSKRRYIGKTKNLNKRWKDHRNLNSKTLRQCNFNKCHFILEEVGNKDNIQDLEQKWIDYYGGISKLLNRVNAKKCY